MRRRNIYLLAFLASSGLVVPVVGSTAFGVGGQPVRQVIAALSDPLAILEGRSPGVRRGGAVQSKFAAAPASRSAPRERVLSGARERTSTPPAAPEPATLAQQLIDEVLPPETILVPELASLPVLPKAQRPGGFSVQAVLVTPSNSGGDGATGGDEGPISLPTPPSAVPEPSTWLTMIIGMGLVGTSLRRRRKCAGHAA